MYAGHKACRGLCACASQGIQELHFPLSSKVYHPTATEECDRAFCRYPHGLASIFEVMSRL